MVLALCACLVGLLVLVALRRKNPARPEALSDQSANVLDRGLSHLIRSVTREPEPPPPSLPRTTTIGDMTSASLSARSRLARGTPTDAVLIATRLPATLPQKSGASADTSGLRQPRASLALADGSTSRLAPTKKTGFEADDDAPTTLARTLSDRVHARR